MAGPALPASPGHRSTSSSCSPPHTGRDLCPTLAECACLWDPVGAHSAHIPPLGWTDQTVALILQSLRDASGFAAVLSKVSSFHYTCNKKEEAFTKHRKILGSSRREEGFGKRHWCVSGLEAVTVLCVFLLRPVAPWHGPCLPPSELRLILSRDRPEERRDLGSSFSLCERSSRVSDGLCLDSQGSSMPSVKAACRRYGRGEGGGGLGASADRSERSACSAAFKFDNAGCLA